MRDFDTDTATSRARRLADRDFTIGGLPFRLRASKDVPSAAVEAYREMWSRLIDPDAPTVQDPEYVAAWAELMRNVLEPGQAEHLIALGQPGTVDAITIPDAIEVAEWAVGVVAGRPMGASSASSNGSTAPIPAPDGSPSTDPSLSPVPAGSND